MASSRCSDWRMCKLSCVIYLRCSRIPWHLHMVTNLRHTSHIGILCLDEACHLCAVYCVLCSPPGKEMKTTQRQAEAQTGFDCVAHNQQQHSMHWLLSAMLV